MFYIKTKTKAHVTFLFFIFVASMLLSSYVTAQNKNNGDEELLNLYSKTKGYHGVIQFDPANIKQFWIDDSVFAMNDSINISLESGKSLPLRIKLQNVDESMDCKIEVVATTPNCNFVVTNTLFNTLSSSQKDDDFLAYHVTSSLFHLADTPDFTFHIQFNTGNASSIAIKRIFLSFSKNKTEDSDASHNRFSFDRNDITLRGATLSDSVFKITGKQTQIISNVKIPVSNHPVFSSVTIENTGDNPTCIYIGYAVYTKDGIWLSGSNYPFKNVKNTLNLVSAKAGDNKIIVDSNPDAWEKNCYLAMDVKEDLSDIPNTTLADGKIVDVKPSDNGKYEITLSKPLTKDYPSGTKIRIHGKSGDYLYTNKLVLNPGEEKAFVFEIAKDEFCTQYTSDAIPRGANYLVPIILSYSVDANKDNTILIKDSIYSF